MFSIIQAHLARTPVAVESAVPVLREALKHTEVGQGIASFMCTTLLPFVTRTVAWLMVSLA